MQLRRGSIHVGGEHTVEAVMAVFLFLFLYNLYSPLSMIIATSGCKGRVRTFINIKRKEEHGHRKA